ncbi:anthrone oxygenase family protein [Spirosoma areae]
MAHLPQILVSLFILNLGTAFGAGLYETKIILPQWFPKSTESGYRVNTQAMRDIDTGRKFWAFVTTGPLTLLTVINLVFAWQSQQPGSTWWLAAALITLIERIGTFSFFIPTAIKLQQADNRPASSVTRLVSSWIGFNYVRNALTLIAWVLALIALSLCR